jgi:hypothetical protein
MSRGSVLVAILMMIPTGVLAQRMGGMAGSGHVATGAPRAQGIVMRSAPAAPAHFSVRLQPTTPRSGGTVVRGHSIRTNQRPQTKVNVVPFGPFGDTEFQDAPGLGFDFPHLAAINANRHPRFRNFGGVFPFGFNGFLLGASPVIVEDAAPAEATEERPDAEARELAAENAQLREVVRLGRSRSRATQNDSAPRELASREDQPAPEQEKTNPYVFVRRDGSLVFALGYSWDKDTLRYVTPDGARRSIQREALDLPATQEFNEQRGLNFHLG